jgi:alkylresorcinol/alkylpyrone synthase
VSVPVLPRISRLEVSDANAALSQDEALSLLGLEEEEFAQGLFGRSAVATRDLSLLTVAPDSTLQGRSARIEDRLFDEAVELVERLEVDPAQIGTVVTASLYSLGGPTLAHRLVERFRMDPATDKYHVVGVGCASLVPLTRLVSQSLTAHPGKKGLIVAAESMSGMLMRSTPNDHRAKTVGSALFGDGCAAAVIENAPGPRNGTGEAAVVASQVHQIEGTLGAVRMELSDDDSYLHLDRDLPDLAAAGLPELVDAFLRPNGLSRADVDHWIVHPGGPRILDRVGEALDLSHAQLQDSYHVLASRGNVGTPSIFYVLNETLRRRPGHGQRGLMVTIGPGITVGLMLLEF